MIEIVSTCNKLEFKTVVEGFLREGYKILSTNIGFVNSEAYDFCDCYQAILLKED